MRLCYIDILLFYFEKRLLLRKISFVYNYFLLISCPLLTYIKIIEINEVYPFLCNSLFYLFFFLYIAFNL